MSRANPSVMFGFFVAVIVAICGVSLLKGGVYIGKHEGDTLHMLQIVFRMAMGEWPHLDFMTPIGALAAAPIALFVTLGFGAGMSFLLAQALVAVVLLLPVWWAAWSRLPGLLAYLFGLIVLVLVAALVHGETERSISLSMHYNRWAWAVSFVAMTLAVLPNRGAPRPLADGLAIGLAMAALVMLKVTYFALFSLPLALALLLRGSTMALFVAFVTGAVIAGLITLAGGTAFWLAYLGDLLMVAQSEIRPAPGDAFSAVVGAPAYIAGSIALIAGVVLLRQGHDKIGGLVLLLLTPGFFFVTYQNFGNDPQWLLFLGVLLLASLPKSGLRNGFGWEVRQAQILTATVAMALAAPSFLNLAYSPFRHFAMDVSGYTPMLPSSGPHNDMRATRLRGAHVVARSPLDGPDTEFASYAEVARLEEPLVFHGTTLPDCEVQFGHPAYFETITRDLDEAGLAAGKQILAADLFSSYWLYGALKPLKNGAPWHYGGLPGFENADYLLVPLCPIVAASRRAILKEVEKAGITMNEVRRTRLYILYQRG